MQKVASPMLVFGIAFVACLLLVSPLLLAGRILAFGDGLIESYPAFVSPINFWDPNMLLGFPVFADPNFASFYPLRLLAYVPYGFNLYVMLAYAVAAASTFGYVYDVAHDRSAAVTAACSFTLGGFMVSHFGHPMIVGPTAWTITALWALQRYLSSKMTGWLAVVAVGFGISCTAGQPQITLFAIVLLTAYATTLSFSLRRPLRSLVPAAKSFVAIILGIGIGAVAIVPAVHLAVESSRSGLTFAQFVEDQLPLQHLARSIVFPFVAGGGSADLTGPLLDSAASPFTEVAPYIGIAALALAIACMLAPRNRIIIFWGVISVAGLALAAGDALPFAAWTYIIPPFNSFRIPGRHAYEFTLAISILAGLSVASIVPTLASRRRLMIGLAITALLLAAALGDVASADLAVLKTPAVTRFVELDCAQAILLVFILFLPVRERSRRAIISAVVGIGSITFAATSYARDVPSWSSVAKPPAYAAELRRLPMSPGQRIYTYGIDPALRLQPNLPQVWGLPEVAGYTPLQRPAMSAFLREGDDGRLLDPAAKSIDLSAVRYVAVASQPPQRPSEAAPFAGSDLALFLSPHAPSAPSSIVLGINPPFEADRIAVVSALGESVTIPQGTVVAELDVNGKEAVDQRLLLRAGIDTAELAYGRPSIHGIRHSRAPVYSANPLVTWFVATIQLRQPTAIHSLRLRLTSNASFNLRYLSLVDSVTHHAYAVSAESAYDDVKHYRFVGTFDGVAIFENLLASPRAWTNEGPVRFRRLEAQRRDYDVNCAHRCVLVSSDAWNTSWQVTIDEQPAELTKGPAVLESVSIPAGHHRVTFRYSPLILGISAVLSTMSLLFLAAWIVIDYRSARQRSEWADGAQF